MDTDQLSRALKDLEYRVRALEKAHNPPVLYGGSIGGSMADALRKPPTKVTIHESTSDGVTYRAHIKHDANVQWCSCGRDHCRAPDCPSHKPDPMGR